ncbi:CPBP family intramembrane metalloprotease [Prauserella sp. ASG 168]|uniref:CPBP family intramembrane metalloprotease n=1 Tax=Prauserella cavernicola TaxID=2800127 RepID=A0A934V6P4_9PSEU|nr:CPBP family intramembrane metalloprotease [Prauserella cavernicola]
MRRGLATAGAAGAGLLGRSFAEKPGSRRFYGLTGGSAVVLLTAGVLGRDRTVTASRASSPVAAVALGAAAFGVFRVALPLAERVPGFSGPLARIRSYATEGPASATVVTTLANGVAEEVFFRGAVFAAAGRTPVVTSTLLYMLSTSATRNPALVGASAVMGVLFGLQRQSTGGVREPVLTHLVWSALMLRHLTRVKE